MKVYISGLTSPELDALFPGLLQNEAAQLMLKMEEFLTNKGRGKKQGGEHRAA